MGVFGNMNMTERQLVMDGKAYYDAAISLIDMHDKRFCDMMAEDHRRSVVERKYFTGDFRGLELYGWITFTQMMEASGQSKWLRLINQLDEDAMSNILERRMYQALEGRVNSNGVIVVDKDSLDAATKAIQGLLSKAKLATERESAGGDVQRVDVHFFGAAGDPITGLGPDFVEDDDSAEQRDAVAQTRTVI